MPPEFIERLANLKNLRYLKESTGEMQRIDRGCSRNHN
jgi:dihydrodipicolinate synthase/N-acetylneuraminate lyase